jgi:hypothetical protein
MLSILAKFDYFDAELEHLVRVDEEFFMSRMRQQLQAVISEPPPELNNTRRSMAIVGVIAQISYLHECKPWQYSP